MNDLNGLQWTTQAPVKQQQQQQQQQPQNGGKPLMADMGKISSQTSMSGVGVAMPMSAAAVAASRPAAQQPTAGKQVTSTAKADPFANLMSGSGIAAGQQQQRMSMAEQQKMSSQSKPMPVGGNVIPQQKQVSTPMAQQAQQKQSSQAAWDFDALLVSPQAATVNSTRVAATSTAPSQSPIVQDDDPFGIFGVAQQNSAKGVDIVAATSPVKTEPVVVVGVSKTSPVKQELPVKAVAKPLVSTALPAPIFAQQGPAKSPVKDDDVDSIIAKMVDIGFGAKESSDALQKTNNNMQDAINILLNPQSQAQASKDDKANKLNKLVDKASVLGGTLFQRAKVLYSDSSKKLGQVIANARTSQEDVTSPTTDGLKKIESQESLNDVLAEQQQPAVVAKKPAVERKQRPQPTLQQSQVDSSMVQCQVYKDMGGQFFKQGQYGDAEEQYTKAIDTLVTMQQSSWYMAYATASNVLVQLHNNRAACRLKNGTYSGAVEDCGFVLAAVQAELSYADTYPSLDDTQSDKSKDLQQQLSKALLRRATAFENMEKWELALQDYSECVRQSNHDGTSVPKNVYEGMRRCQKAIAPTQFVTPQANKAANVSSFSDFEQPRIQPVATKLVPQSSMKDMESMLGGNVVSAPSVAPTASATPSPATLAMKDKTDALITKWKAGKAQNIRALLSTLDQILAPYPAIMSNNGGWKTPQMSELITNSQVKIRYMKAIAKVHPDKVSQCSQEEAIVCSSVFSQLNEAWDVFKQQNGMK